LAPLSDVGGLPLTQKLILRAPPPQNFPLLKRLKTVLLSNNLIFRMSDDIQESLPNLETLMMANNSILNLNDLLPLAKVSSLRRLVLTDNHVTKQPNYRLFLIQHLPQVTVLDFKKVKPKVEPRISIQR